MSYYFALRSRARLTTLTDPIFMSFKFEMHQDKIEHNLIILYH